VSDLAKKKRPAVYADLLKLPEGAIGEIVDGELFVSPRPNPQHALAEAGVTEVLRGPFQSGKDGGPGGWWILPEPELHLGPDENDKIFVPDLAGWKKERLPKLPSESFISVVPDWICEILSPSNMRLDRTKKVPRYGELGVRHLWLVSPRDKTLEVLKLENGKWVLLGTHADDEKVRAEPFQAIEFDLRVLWE